MQAVRFDDWADPIIIHQSDNSMLIIVSIISVMVILICVCGLLYYFQIRTSSKKQRQSFERLKNLDNQSEWYEQALQEIRYYVSKTSPEVVSKTEDELCYWLKSNVHQKNLEQWTKCIPLIERAYAIKYAHKHIDDAYFEQDRTLLVYIIDTIKTEQHHAA